MIPLPQSATLVRNKGAELELGKRARAWIESEERTPGLHASDLLDTRIAFWQRADPKPLPDRLITMFLVGKVLHAFVLGSVSGTVDLDTTDSGSSTSSDLGISFSPDAFLHGKVRELKTSRSFYEPKSLEDVSLYLEQLLVYMVATDTLASQLWVLYLNLRDDTGKTAPAFRCFDFVVSQEDLARVKEYLVATKTELESAIARQDWKSLPLCREFKCGANNCDWYGKCKPEGRWGDPVWDGLIKKPRKK